MIYIATHKKFNVPNLNGYCALQVGAEGKEKYGYLRDNIGNHISGKNANYCELTGLYWIWKNTDDSYKGWCIIEDILEETILVIKFPISVHMNIY